VVVLDVVPVEELDTEFLGDLQVSKPIGKVRPLLQRLELRL
jgi:hypothetical protein